MAFGLLQSLLDNRKEHRRTWWLSRYQALVVSALSCFIVGVVLAAYQMQPDGSLPAWTAWWNAACWSILFFGLALLSSKRVVWLLLFCLIATAWGGAYYRAMHLQPSARDVSHWASRNSVYSTKRVSGEWFVNSDDPKKGFLNVQTVNGQRSEGWLLVRSGSYRMPPAGSVIAVEGQLAVPEVSPIPGAFNEKRYLASQRVTAVLHHVTKTDVITSKPISWAGHINRSLSAIRGRIANTFREALVSPLSEIMGGIVLGDQAIPLAPDVREKFTQTGLVHLLAASGMNVAIVAGFLFAMARLMRLPGKLQLVMAMLGALLYACLSGLSPSVLRATTMLEIALGLKLLDKTLQNTSVLLLAVFALILWNPELSTNIGFQLSVLTTLGIMTMVTPLQELAGYYWGKRTVGIFLLPMVAQLWAIPLLVVYFNELPLLAVLLNIIVVPLVTVLTCIGFVAGSVSLVSPWLGVLCAKLSWLFVLPFYGVVSLTHGWQWTQWHVPSFPMTWLLLVYGAFVFIAYALNSPKKATAWVNALGPALKPKRLISVLLLASCVMLVAFRNGHVTEQISVLPLQANMAAFLVESENTSPVLILPDTASVWYSRKIADYLRHRNIRELSSVLWYSTPKRSAKSETQVAVLGMLKEKITVRHVASISEQTKIGAWRLRAFLLFSDAALKDRRTDLAQMMLWRLENEGTCFQATWRDVSVKPLVKNNDCLTYWQQARHGESGRYRQLPYAIEKRGVSMQRWSSEDFLQLRKDHQDWYIQASR